jgi:pyruvate dehydrogenase E2 component (dihydrolipoamide acetyltransferase)
MSVSVSMPQLGESVTEGTVTRWLKREGEHVDADEPLLEVSTDKVDTEIPSPVSGTLRGITVAEDETVAVGAQLAVIDEDGSAGESGSAPESAPAEAEASAAPAAQAAPAQAAEPAAPATAAYEQPGYQQQPAYQQQPQQQQPQQQQPQQQPAYQAPQPGYQQQQPAAYQPGYQQQAAGYQAPASYQGSGYAQPGYQQQPTTGDPYQGPSHGGGGYQATAYPPAAPAPAEHPYPAEPPAPAPSPEPPAPPAESAAPEEAPAPNYDANGTESPYVTPLVRKLAAEHGIDLAAVTGTGVGGRIRKQDVLDAARTGRTAAPAAPAAPPAPPAAAPAQAAPAQAAPAEPDPGLRRTRPAIAESSLRGTTERMSRARQVIAQRMVESLQTSAQLTTVVEADVTAIARLRGRAKAAFEAREGVKLSFLPFFALATVEALKAHPKLNAVVDTASGTVTYHDAEHLGIAVDTERGLMVPVIKKAGDLNIGGLARKIADLAARTRAGQVSPDDLAGGTFTLTNTGSRGALFDTPIINQPQVGILGTGTVVKRAVVVEDPALGEVITVRSMVYLALTYDHRLVDGADAARFLVTLKARLEEGAFETELGL